MTKKLLAIFQLSNTLLFIKQSNNKFIDNSFLNQIKPNLQLQQGKVYYRPDYDIFVSTIFLNANIQIAIWSSINPKITGLLTKQLFKQKYKKLLFVSGTHQPNLQAIQKQRDLRSIQKLFPEFEQSNILLFSPFPNLLDKYKQNDVYVPPFNEHLEYKFKYDTYIQSQIKYLFGLKKIFDESSQSDVRRLLQPQKLIFINQRYSQRKYKQWIY